MEIVKAKQRLTTDWYSTKRISEYKCKTMLIFGQRTNGKTFAVKKEKMIETVSKGYEFVYVRRCHRMITRRKVEKLFNDMSDYIFDKLGDYLYYDGQGTFYLGNDDKRKVAGYVTSIEDTYKDKGYPSNNVRLYYLDEFMDRTYFDEEIAMYLNSIANYLRTPEQRAEAEVILTANTILKSCPYFDYYGIDISKMEQGDIAIIHGSEGGKAAAEYCKKKVRSFTEAVKDEIFGFGGGASAMILHGDWEYKDCNIDSIDGIGWNSRRRRIPTYLTGFMSVYEMSFTISNKDPIVFVRKVNTQNGLVSQHIKYNLSFDNKSVLINKNGIVPRYRKVSKYMDKNVVEEMDLVKECLRVGRIVYDTYETGTEFEVAINEVL